MKKIEMKKGEEYKLWRKTRQWSIDALAKIYRELGVRFAHTFYESEYVDKGKDIVAGLYAKHILTKSDGAIIADLEKDNLGVLVIIRSDGTALYPVADLALAMEKFKRYKPDRSIYIVDTRQSLYFKQLFALLDRLGYKKEMIHLPYDFVKLPSGMMKSRTGDVVTYEDLRAQLYGQAKQETKKRHPDWPDKQIAAVAEKIIIGAIKFEMLKVSANQIITFDIEKALRFEGFTAAYLQYACARINSIFRKSETEINKMRIDYSLLAEAREQNMIISLAKYPEAVKKAGANYDPSEVAKFIFNLAAEFNDYYQAVPILKAEPAVMRVRLALITSVRQVIVNGLNILGISAIDEM
jgi:arginyl-tRNA synthetase